MFGDHVSGRFLARWSSDFKHRVITECQSLPSSPYVDELLAASGLEVENDYGKYDVFLYPTYNMLPISINPICNSHPKLISFLK